jgi:ferrochelatase
LSDTRPHTAYDAVLLIAFGGPTQMCEVRPFIEEVLRGRPVPPERIEAVVHHYELIGGRSPLNELTLRQACALEAELRAEGPVLPVYVGMRSWVPYLRETIKRMRDDGVRDAVGIIMTAQQTDASWGRYQREVAAGCESAGADAPRIYYVEEWHAHPLFIEAVSERTASALWRIAPERQAAAHMLFTAHSVPTAMAAASPYVEQVVESSRLVAQRVGQQHWSVAYQSRSGSPGEPWLEPDIAAAIRELAERGTRDLVVVPIGFICDHVEVLYDLDIEARQIAEAAGFNFVRAGSVNDHPAFIRMLADVVRRRVQEP